MEIAPIPVDTYTLGFIGAGKMAESIARGAVRSGVLPPSRIRTAVHSNPARRTAFESFGVTVLSSNDEVLPFPLLFFCLLNKRHAVFILFFFTLAGRSPKQRRRSIGQTSIRYCCTLSAVVFDLRFHLLMCVCCCSERRGVEIEADNHEGQAFGFSGCWRQVERSSGYECSVFFFSFLLLCTLLCRLWF